MNYTKTAATTLRLLTKHGQTVTRRVITAGTYDTATGGMTNTTVDTTRNGALFDFGQAETTVRGSLIQGTDKRLLLDASGAVALSDNFVIGGVVYTVVSIGEVNPAGTPVLYDLHIRA